MKAETTTHLARAPRHAGTLLLVLIAGCGGVRESANEVAGVPEPFRGTVRITLTSLVKGAKAQACITDPHTVRAFLAVIQLVPKEPCTCGHFEEAVFEKKRGSSVAVSLCDHCFDISGRHYKMPAEFYRLFQREIGKVTAAPIPSAK